MLLLFGLLAAAAPVAGAQPRPTHSRASRALGNVERIDSLGGITEYRLRSNGMKILLSPNHAAPVITFMVVYHVGSRNEAPGNTGSAHLLEHMLFNKSTKNFGKANHKKTVQEVLYESGADYASSNMTTWYDRMNGYSTLPAEKLETAMKIEADRLGRALILDSERQPEMSVVRNEYEIGENSPYRALDKAVIAEAIQAHPYHWNTIGYRSDIEGVTTEKLREHYRDFFYPDNAEAILVGDFDTAAALAMFDREFAAFARSKTPIPQVITVEPPQEGERRVTVRRPGQVGIVEIAYMRPNALDPDYVPLDVLSSILTAGVNSRLYQALVEPGLATDVDSWNYTLRDPYPIVAEATVAPGRSHDDVERAMKAALYRIGKEGVSATELDRAKSQLEVSVVRGRDGTYELASSLGEAVASANWKWFVGYVDAVRSVSADDVKRVAAKYLVPDHATVGWFVPASGEKTEAKVGLAPAPVRDKRAGAGGASEAAASGFGSRTLHKVLGNGLTLDVVVNRAVPTVAIQGTVFAGRMEAPGGKPAVPDLTAIMLTRGTKRADKRVIAARLDGVGAQLQIFAGVTEATIVGNSLSRDLRLLLGTLADELANPAFADSEVAKAKLEMRANVLRSSESTAARGLDRLTRLAYPEGHPYRAATTDAMLASLDKANAADLRAFWRARYGGAGIILAVVGDVDPQAVAALADSLFGGIERGARPTHDAAPTAPNAPEHVVETIRGKANVDFLYGQASGLKRNDPDYEAALVANAALGQSSLTSRIGKRVRDTEGLSYNLYSRWFWPDYADGLWAVDVAVAPQNVAKALRSTKEEIDRYGKEGITDAEVEVQREFFAGNYLVRLGTNAGVAAALCTAEKFGYGPGYLDDFPKRIRAVTKAQVDDVLRRRFHPDKMHLVVAGDLDSIPQ
ncbi:MAG TPA: pitrilysin family protein [Candidatus Eisenbacteria bacterium]|nr:pitrilysin family protein [Candidatus Eisenbacteria bacterium]